MTSSGLRTVRTMCPMNCHPTLCGMLVDIEDGRVLGVRGDPDNPDSQGFLCVRGQASHEIIGNPARLLHPLVRARRDDAFREASWDEALDLVAERMRALGGDAARGPAFMRVIGGEALWARGSGAKHRGGFDVRPGHVASPSRGWGGETRGGPAERTAALARRSAGPRPATIVLGGSSLHK